MHEIWFKNVPIKEDAYWLTIWQNFTSQQGPISPNLQHASCDMRNELVSVSLILTHFHLSKRTCSPRLSMWEDMQTAYCKQQLFVKCDITTICAVPVSRAHKSILWNRTRIVHPANGSLWWSDGGEFCTAASWSILCPLSCGVQCCHEYTALL